MCPNTGNVISRPRKNGRVDTISRTPMIRPQPIIAAGACRYGAHARNHGGHKVHVVSIKQERKRDSGQREDQKGQRGADKLPMMKKANPSDVVSTTVINCWSVEIRRMQAEEERYQELRQIHPHNEYENRDEGHPAQLATTYYRSQRFTSRRRLTVLSLTAQLVEACRHERCNQGKARRKRVS